MVGSWQAARGMKRKCDPSGVRSRSPSPPGGDKRDTLLHLSVTKLTSADASPSCPKSPSSSSLRRSVLICNLLKNIELGVRKETMKRRRSIRRYADHLVTKDNTDKESIPDSEPTTPQAASKLPPSSLVTAAPESDDLTVDFSADDDELTLLSPKIVETTPLDHDRQSEPLHCVPDLLPAKESLDSPCFGEPLDLCEQRSEGNLDDDLQSICSIDISLDISLCGEAERKMDDVDMTSLSENLDQLSMMLMPS